jgi:multiple sugar transport system ATP-binding protein
MATVELRNLSKYFGRVEAVRDVNLRIQDQEFLTLLGPSGCGKTTTLNMIAGLEKPSRGDVVIDNRVVTQVPPARRDVAMVFQNYALYPHMTIRENMGFALKIRKLPAGEIEAKILEAARVLKIDHLLDRRPSQLSGGQRQRVALGRAIVRNPKVFLLDEPLSNLDAALRVQMRAELKLIFNRLGATAIYVTHDQAEAMTMSSRIAIFNSGQIQQVDTPLDVYYRPVNRFIASFIGSPPINVITCTLQAQDGRILARNADFSADLTGILGDVAVKAYVGRPVELGIRPEDVAPVTGTAAATVQGRIEVIEQMGSTTVLYLNTGAQLLTSEAHGSLQAEVGDHLEVRIPPDRIYLFDPQSGLTILSPQVMARSAVQLQRAEEGAGPQHR